MSIENAQKFLKELKEEQNKLNGLIYSIEVYLGKNKNIINHEIIFEQEMHSHSQKSLSDHILEYLKEKDKICSSQQIATDLSKKNIQTESQNFPAMINSVLYQLKKKNKVASVRRGQWKIN